MQMDDHIQRRACPDGTGGGRQSLRDRWARRVGVPCLLLVAVGCSSLPPASPPASPEMIEQQRADIARSLVETGRAVAAQGDSLRAEQYFRAALDAGAPAGDVLPLLIAVCVKGQRYRAAVADTEEFLRQHPNASRLRFVLASLLTGLGDFPAAVDELVRLVSAEPDHVLGHYALAVLYRDRLHHAERADQEFRTYLALAPSGSHAEEARASLLQPVHAE
jgi:tetratricopeptide (TPR) repeat protein